MTSKNLYIITGSSSGIGRAMIEELAANSDNFIIGIARNNDFEAKNYQFQALDLSKIDLLNANNLLKILKDLKNI